MTYRSKPEKEYEPIDPDIRWLTVVQLAERLAVSPATVRRHVKQGDWPYWSGGERIFRFTAAHIKHIEEIGHREPAPKKRGRGGRGR